MAIISARVNDQAKIRAEEIAESIGLSLSSVINVFINRFIAEEGFPFSVTVPKGGEALSEKRRLETQFAKAVEENAPIAKLPVTSYLDPESGEIK